MDGIEKGTSYVSPYRDIHPSCPQPASGALYVWRYLDLERLIGIVSAGELWFSRVDLLGDEFEGSVTRGVYDYWKANPRFAAVMERMRPELKRNCYASCWHANETESEAMWRLYCPNLRGVALRTTYERLDASLPRTILLGMVSYIDYEAGTVGDDAAVNALAPMMHKRLAFRHEHEVRALIWRKAKLLAEGVAIEELPSDAPPGIGVAWDLASVIENVYVSPYADEWYRDVVMQVLLKFVPAMAGRLTWSTMKAVPLY